MKGYTTTGVVFCGVSFLLYKSFVPHSGTCQFKEKGGWIR